MVYNNYFHIGMMRSGIHMILLWLINKTDNITFFNNIYDFNNLNNRIIKKNNYKIFDIKDKINENPKLSKKNLYSIESRSLDIIPKCYINNKNNIFIILIRNPYNNFASNLKYIENKGKSIHIKKIINENLFTKLWIELAEKYLDITNKIKKNRKIYK